MSEHYDVGILGLWSGCNYGSIATYFALNQVLTSMGKSVLMIDKPVLSENDAELKDTHSRRFGQEHYNISRQYRLDELGELNDICDSFVIGSDQVWNYGISKNFGKMFYLDFASDEKKKIAYAVSFGHGVDFAPEEERDKISRLMSRFDAISVREADGVRLCRDAYAIRAQQVLDPVFLPDPSVYQALIEKSSANENNENEEEPFLAAYILDPTPEKREAILHLSKELGDIRIINLLDGFPWLFEKNRELMDLPGCIENLQVEDWLYYLSKAKFILTDSCHGASFALIFKKNFIAITNKRRGFSRFKSLSELFHFESHLVTDPKRILTDGSLMEPIDYAVVDGIMEAERKRCCDFLKYALDESAEKISVVIPLNTVKSKLDEKMCTGCSACVNICPKNALTLKPDVHGYYRSFIDYDKCIDCGLCVKTCPAIKLPDKSNEAEPKLYAFIAADEKILESSSSGGIFPLLAREAFKRSAAVAGAAWTDDFYVKHIIIEAESEMPKLQKSKYLQSYLGDIDRQVKQKLESGQFVLFSGCPCQVAGLKAYLGRDYENLLTVDLLCGNSPSAGFFQKYLRDSFPQGITNYQFRYKKQGWNADCLTLTLTDGTVLERRGGKQDDYQKIYHNHTMCPPHCEQCKYQSLPRYGDLTIGDFWGYKKRDGSVDTSRGISAVLCNNEKGRAFLESISESDIKVKKEVPLKWLGSNGYAVKGHNFCSPYRDRFYGAIQRLPFSRAVKEAVKSADARKGQVVSNSYLHYNVSQLHFRFDEKIWEEHFINGYTVLITKIPKAPLGHYATIPLNCSLKKGRTYNLSVRFKIRSASSDFNLHVKESSSRHVQVIHRHKVQAQNADEWVSVSRNFIADSDMLDEFMVGASHVNGSNRFLMFDYINITELKK